MTNNLAPIGVSTYGRLQHLQRTITALQKNTLAQESELFVFSDAPRLGDEDRVAAVRKYLRKIDGFKEVHVIERTENSRVVNNRGGMRMLLDQFGKMIFLEEDVVTAPGFLSFMNQALTTYRNNDKVFAITGYCPPIDARKYISSDAFLLQTCNFWGFAIWKERYDQVSMQTPSCEVFKTILNPFSLASYMRIGSDMPHLFLLDAQGIIDAGDIKFAFEMWKKGSYLLIPTFSLSMSIGLDGTGVHCGMERKYDTEMSSDVSGRFKLPREPELNNALVAKYRDFRSEGRTYNWLKLIYIQLIRFSRFKLRQKLVAMRTTMKAKLGCIF